MKKGLLVYLLACFLVIILFGCKSKEVVDVADLSETEVDSVTIVYGAGSYAARITDIETIYDVVYAYNNLVFEPMDSNESGIDILTQLSISFNKKDGKVMHIFVSSSGILRTENKKYTAVSGKLFYDKLLKIYKDNN